MRGSSAAMIASLVAATLAVTGCQNAPKTDDTQLVQVTDRELVSMMEKAQKKKRLLVLVDPRSPAKFAQGHLPGAINIPLPKMLAGDPRLAKANQIVVYGSGWMDYSSPAGAKRLLALGYTNVFDFRGGLELWKQANRPIEGEAPGTAGAPGTPAATGEPASAGAS